LKIGPPSPPMINASLSIQSGTTGLPKAAKINHIFRDQAIMHGFSAAQVPAIRGRMY